jgi:hypothetical protein
VRAWRPRREGWRENQTGYLSVNAVTLELAEGLDLRAWHERGWISYLDCREYVGQDRLGSRILGGCIDGFGGRGLLEGTSMADADDILG